MTWTPHATVAVVVEQDDQYLVVEEHRDGLQVFNQPAGHVEAGETLTQAALRETLEETGYEVDLTHFLGLYTWHAAAKDVTYYRFAFVARLGRKVSDQLDKDITATHWWDYPTLQARADQLRSPLVMRCFNDYRAHVRWPLDIITEL